MSKYTSIVDNMYRDLSDEAKVRFRQWARNNHQAGQDINCTWHPIIRDECRLMDEEGAVLERLMSNRAFKKEEP